MTEIIHICRFRLQSRERAWSLLGGYRERAIEHISVCATCGKERAAKFRKVVFIERESSGADKHSAPDLRVLRLARTLDQRFQTTEVVRVQPLIRRLGGVHIEADLERLAIHGGVRLIYRPRAGSLNLHAVRVIDRAGLAEIAEPGAAERRRVVLIRARDLTVDLQHRQAQAIADLLRADSAALFDYQFVSALAGLARLVEDGEILPERLFSVKYLGHSKRLRFIRRRLERLVGPLERLGIRDTGQIVLVGGQGMLNLNGVTLDLSRFRHLGLALQDAIEIQGIDFPASGLLIVENLTPFYACVAQFSRDRELMVLWTAGFPGRGVRAIIRRAAECEVPIRVWCDLDLGGVRIARIVVQVARAAQTVLMDPETIRSAQLTQPIGPELITAMRRDLTLHPADPLAESLRMLLERGVWIEQETLLDRVQKAL
jgi:hypothetical protein